MSPSKPRHAGCPCSTALPGLRDALGATAVTTDFTQPATVARDLERLRTPGVLPAVREAGYANAARYPLSATARALQPSAAGSRVQARAT